MNPTGINLTTCMHYTPTRYKSSLIRFPNKDGVMIVICIVCRKELSREDVQAAEAKRYGQ